MTVRVSPIVSARMHAQAWTDWTRTVVIPSPGGFSGPATTLEHFRLTTPASAPRLAAGRSSLTYVLGDSDGSLRTRDSLGNEVLMRPGGLLWLPANRAVAREHLPAEPGRDLRCLQLRVRPDTSNPGASSSLLKIEPEQVPEWRSRGGDRIRIVTGSYAGQSAPPVLPDAMNLLDVRLRCAVYFDVGAGHNALVYVLQGIVLALTEGHTLRLECGQAFALHNPRGNALLQLVGSGHVLILDGFASCDPYRTGDDAPPTVRSGGVVRIRDPLAREAAFG